MTTAPKKPAAKAGRAPAVRRPRAVASTAPTTSMSAALLPDLRQLIEASRRAAAVTVNMAQTQLYWRVGQRIRAEVLGEQRARYGEEIVATLSRQLVADYGRGFEERNLRRMVQFAEAFPEEEIVVTLSRQLSWSHFLALLPVKDPLGRDFYAQMSQLQGWSVRTLRERVDSMLFERTALSSKPEELIRQELDALGAQGQVSPALLLKDPYVLDFLGLEDAVLRELELAQDKSGIHVAGCLRVLPPREVFQRKIREAMVQVGLRMAQKESVRT